MQNNNDFSPQNYQLEGEILNIKTYPSPILTKVAKSVTQFDDSLRLLAKNMLYTMYTKPGIGLAAPQVGLSERMFVLDINFVRQSKIGASGQKEFEYANFEPYIFVNPEISNCSGEIFYEEGCLSVPGVYEKVKRFNSIHVKYQDLYGKEHQLEASETLAVCIQHENDHLDGIVFVDRLPPLKRGLLKKKLIKDAKKK